MPLEQELKQRSDSKCELCSSNNELSIFEVPPIKSVCIDSSVYACSTCINQINNPDTTDAKHWRCLNDSMWSEYRPVKIVVWRMLYRLKSEGWPLDLLDMMYIEEEDLEFAKLSTGAEEEDEKVIHRDVNGVILNTGDNVVLIKDLKVKGSSMVAKQGSAVRRISLDLNNAEYIEGKVDGQHIVIITKYVKKS